MFPAWYPLATVLIDDQREWAMWTPTGIYKRLPSQETNRFDAAQSWDWRDVEYFRADSIRAHFERPDVMRRLLSSAGISRRRDADELSAADAPAGRKRAIVQSNPIATPHPNSCRRSRAAKTTPAGRCLELQIKRSSQRIEVRRACRGIRIGQGVSSTGFLAR